MRHYQVTLTTQDVVYNLLTLIKAIDSAYRDEGDHQIIIQSDDGNTAAVFLGNSAVTTASYGIKLVQANDSFNRAGRATLGAVYAVSGTASQKLNISVFA